MLRVLQATDERGEVTPAWRAVLLADPCVYCGGQATGLDHITASSRRGSNGWRNRAPACASCDNDKGATPLLVFLYARRVGEIKTHRRVYQTPGARDQAMRQIRAAIAEQFYRGNIRVPESWQSGNALAC